MHRKLKMINGLREALQDKEGWSEHLQNIYEQHLHQNE